MSDSATKTGRPLVVVVDDDESVRESLRAVLASLAMRVRAFGSAEAFLSSDFVDETRCLILDVAMPDMTGPELHRELQRRGNRIPVVFITAHGDASMRARMLETGASDYLLKPFREAELIDAVLKALTTSEAN